MNPRFRIGTRMERSNRSPGISFPAARHTDLVHSYFLRLTNTQTGAQYEYTVYSDFYKGEKKHGGYGEDCN